MGELDLRAVRAFTALMEHRQFGLAAGALRISQQAVSKRIARLEALLGVSLFDRVPTGAEPTVAALRFLPHAQSLLAVADQAVAAVAGLARPLRVAVLGERQAEMRAMRFYLGRHPDADIELVLSTSYLTSRDALLNGRVDAAFARAHGGPRPLPRRIAAVPAYLDALHLLVGRGHPLAGRSTVALAELAGQQVWVPGAAIPSEWADFYRDLAKSSGVVIDQSPRPGLFAGSDTTRGPAPIEGLVEAVARSDSLATFTGEGFETPWHPEIRRISVVDPTPAYPHALLWDTTDQHPELPALAEHFRTGYNRDVAAGCWIPDSDRALFIS
ncbi:LysR family transcriptional regulator [Nocardia flavorosea]|uniref:LysR family transcriptional regulator n=1 Tax=Nocardia flavorosea TaxID=53429 RepID=UPI0024580EB1|nr:LysR family transcriptional regulator [Nocardia flavorosea]